MARVIIPVYFDYASTLCYIAWKIVSELEQELDFEALWKGVPISMRNVGAKAGREFRPRDYEKVQMVAAETGVPVSPPKRWLASESALEGAELAREARVFPTYHAAVFRAAFEEQEDIGSSTVLGRIAEEVGMEQDRFLADLEAHRMALRIAEYKREADMFSALGYPTFMLGDFPLTGIQPKETMRLLFERFILRREEEPGN